MSEKEFYLKLDSKHNFYVKIKVGSWTGSKTFRKEDPDQKYRYW
jgi:hypothetical protein